VPISFSFGNVIVREGDKADAFMVLASGKARVVKSGEGGQEVSLNVLKPGDGFGEIGLLDPAAIRSATVRASSEVSVLRLDKGVFDALLRADPAIRTSFELHIRYRSLNTFFRLHTPFAKLPAQALGKLLDQFQTLAVGKGSSSSGRAIHRGHVRDRRRAVARLHRDRDAAGVSALPAQGRLLRRDLDLPRQPAHRDGRSGQRLQAPLSPPEAFNRAADENPGLRADIEEHIKQYDYKKVSRVPLDFADEIMPAQAIETERVGPGQVDHAERRRSRPERALRRRRALRQEGEANRPLPLRPADRRDGLRRRVHGDDLPLLRPGGEPGAHRERFSTSTDGTSLRHLPRRPGHGLAARRSRRRCATSTMPLPAIIHWGGNHWSSSTTSTPATPTSPIRRPACARRAGAGGQVVGYAALFDYTAEFEKTPRGAPTSPGCSGSSPHARRSARRSPCRWWSAAWR
jgi:ATP-binding cassette subfamily B protein